ncbi:corticotropin-releasing factor receptor 1-like isoform X2 [Portunus trituberculatus]|uniref:corticotropin-releasing factor receptor 1-like isoform X1 n=1 Tax=Portunus trituberculatus TaxID=210409 RepID=UPI001E1CE50E|nr:corticotropin-releasing factor receptor 1-like isoform X1 [Portunus trituberculatus]XP_045106312.1 corticotropin-releasing factor receptor 1-like isoform X1 [Portunus trituberculatus]XP_045106313.1 corticotropin-releasing factor receptor 1-like isoform X2 [Portunus trituberculatus]
MLSVRIKHLVFVMAWWWWWWSGQCHAIKTTMTTPSTELPSCRMGYSSQEYYPTEAGYYNHQTCFFCYHFVPRHRRKVDLQVDHVAVTLSDGRTLADFIFRVENATYHFDPEDEEAWQLVVESLVDEVEGRKLADCCFEAVTCCNETLSRPQGDPSHCPATWDGWHCFGPTPPGTSVSFTCPHYAYRGLPECALEGHKHCQADGNWTVDEKGAEITDYSTCSHHHHHLLLYSWEAATHAISLLALPPALFVLLYYRQLRVQRFLLHVHLFVALLGKALFNFIDNLALRIPEYKEDASQLDENTVACRVLVFFAKGFNLAVWTWMLAESLYLHRLIVAAFRGGGKTWVYVLVGWVPALVVALCWAAGKAVLEDAECWLGHDPSTSHQLHLIFDIPKLIILLVNTVLLANMTRVLVTKLQGVNADYATATRNAVKATVFLLPMFGLQFFLTLYLPSPSTRCAWTQVYFIVATALDGLQGLYVSVVYCYINKEVRLQVRRSVYRVKGRLYAQGHSTTTHDPRTNISLLSTSHAPPLETDITITTST